MKTLKYIGSIILLSLVLFGCDDKEDEVLKPDNSIIGKWKLVEAYISAGGPQYWVEVEDGEEYVFSSNGTFSSDRYSDCVNGTFSVGVDELKYSYDCNEFTTGTENSEGFITYNYSFELGYLILNPTSVICIEGCSYKYERIGNETN